MSHENTQSPMQLDAASQEIVIGMVGYELGAEACLRYLRKCDRAVVTAVWAKVTEEYMKDRDTYPASMPTTLEEKGPFHLKCASFVFDAASKPSRPLEDYVKMLFAVQAGMQQLSKETEAFPWGRDINGQSQAKVKEILQSRGWWDASQAHHANLLFRRSPFNTTIPCRDELSGEIVKYLVVDCGTSAVKGNYYELQDEAGNSKTVTEEELDAMRVQYL